MPHAIRIHRHGGPEVMRWEEVEIPAPGPGEVRVRHTAVGVNFSDVNVRRGGFYLGSSDAFPITLGNEAAGIVEAVGAGVDAVAPGDRVAYAGIREQFPVETGAYAQARNVPSECLIRLPDFIDDRLAAAMLVKGLTASLVVRRAATPGPGDTVLVHAAASGVGRIVTQWAKHLGATVLGTVGSPDKALRAREAGCDHAILYREVDFVAEVLVLAPDGASILYDGVGGETYLRSLDCMGFFGRLINYGNAEGPVRPVDLRLLSRRSLSVARTGLGSYLAQPRLMRAAVAELFELARTGVLRFDVWRTFPLAEAARAHEAIEARRALGAIVLVP